MISPWEWKVDTDPWYAEIARRVESLDLNASLRECLHAAAVQRRDWLLHPCTNYVTLTDPRLRTDQRRAQLCAWVAAHEDVTTEVRTDRQTLIWMPDGGFSIPPGQTNFGKDVRHHMEPPLELPIEVDPIGHSVGLEQISDERSMLNDSASVELSDLETVMATLQALAPQFDNCFEWVRSTTRVLILREKLGAMTISWTSMQTFGAIWSSAPHSTCDLLETIVHESAHSKLIIAEIGQPLIDPRHSEFQMYSPLRKVDRPMRGVLLAVHAMLYMLAVDLLYMSKHEDDEAARRIALLSHDVDLHLRELRLQACRMTGHGREFLSFMEDISCQLLDQASTL